MRDVSCFSRFQKFSVEGGKRKLKDLSEEFLNAEIQTGHHSSIIDARVALALYRTFQMEIESEYKNNQMPNDHLAKIESQQLSMSLFERLAYLQLTSESSSGSSMNSQSKFHV